MVAQYYINTGSMYLVIWVVALLATGGRKGHPRDNATVKANMGQSPNAVSMLGQRRRRWYKNKAALDECHVFAGVLPLSLRQTQCWSNVGPAS